MDFNNITNPEAWKQATLSEMLRNFSDSVVNLPTEAQRFMVSPTSFINALTGKTALPKETGFAQGATGTQQKENLTVLDPNNRAYMEGYDLGEPFGYAAAVSPLVASGATKLSNKAVQAITKNPNATAMGVIDYASGYSPTNITAWHGSPHTFDKFDMSKVGTGEGAQAYGHGMYFAEAPEVARTYATSGKYETVNDYAQHFLAENKGNKDLALKALNNEVAHFDKNGWTADISKDMVKDIEKSIKNGVQGSNLYKVDIPDEHIPMMLDWDKPLSQQSKEVQQALAKFDPNMYSTKGANYDANELGEHIYQRIIQDNVKKFGHGGNQQRASSDLNALGIKGIRYLDQGSRQGGGTSNFVVFDPTDVKILERNDQPLTRKELLEEQVNKLK